MLTRQQFLSLSQSRLAQIRVADGVEHHRVRRQRLSRIIKLRIKCRGCKGAIVEYLPRRDVSGLHGHQQQRWNSPAGTAMTLFDEGMSCETTIPVRLRRRCFAQQLQGSRQPLMRLGHIRPRLERSLVLFAGSRKLAVFEQHIAQIHAPDRIAGMTSHGLGVRGLRSRAVPGRQRQRTQFVERGEMAGVALQQRQILRLGCLILAFGRKCTRAGQQFLQPVRHHLSSHICRYARSIAAAKAAPSMSALARMRSRKLSLSLDNASQSTANDTALRTKSASSNAANSLK